jgi:uncharacterized membrane protein YwaF
LAQPIALVTLAFLTLAALVFVFQVVRQKRAGQLSASSFSTVLLLVLIGWMTTEVVSDATGELLGEVGRIAHFAVMVLFAATITFQLRRSSEK